MTCPKCQYLGFETGDRCKNCGYEFSLVSLAEAAPVDLPLRSSADRAADDAGAFADDWLGPAVDLPLTSRTPAAPLPERSAPVARAPYSTPSAPLPSTPEPPVDRFAAPAAERDAAAGGVPELPLFHAEADDLPLITLPAAPRAPLSVRRAAETPALRRPPAIRRPEPEERDPMARPRLDPAAIPPDGRASAAAPAGATCGVGPRVMAAVLDVAILVALDLVVLYFTLRMAGLSMTEWRLLPPVPMLAFLVALKLGYVSAFTAASGQTIGKMAARIRVVAADERMVRPSQAVGRTLAAGASIAALGTGFLPALVGAGRLTFHDRVSGTRVVSVRAE
jgi:uncharacterized RDD family membrane protein YckC